MKLPVCVPTRIWPWVTFMKRRACNLRAMVTPLIKKSTLPSFDNNEISNNMLLLSKGRPTALSLLDLSAAFNIIDLLALLELSYFLLSVFSSGGSHISSDRSWVIKFGSTLSRKSHSWLFQLKTPWQRWLLHVLQFQVFVHKLKKPQNLAFDAPLQIHVLTGDMDCLQTPACLTWINTIKVWKKVWSTLNHINLCIK